LRTRFAVGASWQQGTEGANAEQPKPFGLVQGGLKDRPLADQYPSGTVLECSTIEGESPVGDRRTSVRRHLSRAGHVKAGLNRRGPSRKAKYSLATDSEPVARANDGKNPCQGRIVNLKPHAYKRSEGYAQGQPWEGLTACLLHNDPATYGRQPG